MMPIWDQLTIEQREKLFQLWDSNEAVGLHKFYTDWRRIVMESPPKDNSLITRLKNGCRRGHLNLEYDIEGAEALMEEAAVALQWGGDIRKERAA